MSGLPNRRKDHVQKPFPGYMGRSTGIVGTKLLTENADGDGSAGRRNKLVFVKQVIDPVEIHQEDKLVANELRKSSPGMKVGKSPMKMLIAQEMSKEMDSRRKPPSLVARLMGLDDSLPSDPSVVSIKKNLQDARFVQSYSGGAFQAVNSHRINPHDINLYHSEKNGYCDIYEVWKRPSGPNSFKYEALQKCQHIEKQKDKRMALVRQKFTEAKRLAADENLLESKEFHEALEVLSSNQDLFLKFLEEPNSLFSERYRQLHSIPPSPQTRRITVLKPAKTIQTKVTNQMEQQEEDSGWEMQNPLENRNYSRHHITEKLSHPTRIVILKPSPRMHHDMNNPPSASISSPEHPELGDKVAKDGSLSRHRRDESLLSSIFSNGYVGDDSSFTRSEDYLEEGDSTFSDSEIVTATLQNSWDYINNRCGSPYLNSPLSPASYSPESAVIREAKKRLSERWSLVASNVSCPEQLPTWRSSSTLGEVLAIPELKREDSNDRRACFSGSRLNGREDDVKIGMTNGENEREKSSGHLSRSKSLPSSSTYENLSLNMVDSDSLADKPVASMVMMKYKSGKSSFKGRVSSLFFLKNKKAGREKSVSSPLDSSKNGFPSISVDTDDNKFDDSSQIVRVSVPEESSAGNSEALLGRISAQVSLKDYPDVFDVPPKAPLSNKESTPTGEKQDKPRMTEKLDQSQDHPSPTSVLDAPFKDDVNDKVANVDNPQALSRSPPIESISRTLSWDNCSLERSSPNPTKLSRTFSKGVEGDAEDFLFVQNLLSASGFYRNRLNTIFKYWHSPESPLDLQLLDKFLDHEDEGAKIRERRSNQRLVFDCVNEVLLEMGPAANQEEISLASVVWDLVRKKMSGDSKPAPAAMTDNGIQIVDELINKEVTRNGWLALMQSEVDRISQEFNDSIFDDLVREALSYLTVN